MLKHILISSPIEFPSIIRNSFKPAFIGEYVDFKPLINCNRLPKFSKEYSDADLIYNYIGILSIVFLLM